MSRPSPRARVLGALLAGVLTLAGCAAGQRAQTAYEHPVLDGNSAAAGPIDLRAITVLDPINGGIYSPGQSAEVQLTLINNGNTPDQLVGVTSPVAKSSTLTSAEDTATGTEAPTSSASTITSLTIPAGSSVGIGYGLATPSLHLTGLTTTLYPAQTISITFTFARSGAVTVPVSVHLTGGQSSTPTVDIAPSTEG